jgi:two-component system phosphate regulon sensor histidine kinase PhoR
LKRSREWGINLAMKTKLHTKLTIYFLIALVGASIFAKSFLLMAAFLFIAFHVIIYFSVTRPLGRFSAWVSSVLKGGKEGFRPVIFSRDEIGELGKLLRGMVEKDEKNCDSHISQTMQIDAVLSGMAEGVIVTDKDGQILLMNPSARKMFYIERDPEGKKIYEIIFNSAVMQSADKVLKGQERQVSCEIVFDRGEKSMQLMVGVLACEGHVQGAVFVFHDISELKRLEEVRKEFVANVSHELRTPMASIKGYAETLLDGALDDKDHARDFVQTIHDDAKRLNDLINDLLDLARLDSGHAAVNLRPVELKIVVLRVTNILAKAIKDAQLQLVLDVADDLPKVSADEAALMRILLNLLDNAVIYNRPHGTITVKAVVENNRVRVDVIDTGVGIASDDLPRIFERFYRVDKSRSKDSGGTGLGLSIVKHLVQAHGSRITVTSSPGKGSTFSFTLPPFVHLDAAPCL